MDLLDELYQLCKITPSQKDWNRFWSKVKPGSWSECWEWQGKLSPENWTDKGYGLIRMGAIKANRSHRIMAIWLYGRIDSLVVDHVWCNNPPCVNPLHLVPTTNAINLSRVGARTNAAKRFCKLGHQLVFISKENRRRCVICAKVSHDKSRAAVYADPERRAKQAATNRKRYERYRQNPEWVEIQREKALAAYYRKRDAKLKGSVYDSSIN